MCLTRTPTPPLPWRRPSSETHLRPVRCRGAHLGQSMVFVLAAVVSGVYPVPQARVVVRLGDSLVTATLRRLSKRRRKLILYRTALGWRTLGSWEMRFSMDRATGEVVAAAENEEFYGLFT